MELTNEFRVGVPVEQAYAVLTDVERIAPCMPGAQLQEVEGEEYRGIVKVKVGPITANYKGAATFQERDAPRRVVLKAEGRETRGQGNASATITATLTADGEGTVVNVHTDLAVSGKVAQFGRSVLADVSAKLLGQFVDCLESKLLAPGDEASAADGGAVAAGAASEVEPDNGEAVDPAPTSEAKPAVRRVDAPEPEPVDLIATAGNPVAKRVGPVLAALAALWLLRVFVRRRRRR
jgi:carbon monoxide dehydrogenase subunit G